MFFAYGAEVAPKDLIGLAAALTLEELKGIFLGGLACVDNPFIPGVRWEAWICSCLIRCRVVVGRRVLASWYFDRLLDCLVL